MITLQEWLNNKYLTKKEKEDLKKLIIVGDIWTEEYPDSLVTKERAKQIDGGKLDLSEYPNLKDIKIDGWKLKSPLTELALGQQPNLNYLYLPGNKLTSLDLTGCPELEHLWAWDNNLTNLDLSKNEKLKTLDPSHNDFAEQDLSFLSHLVNLEYLNLGSAFEKVERNIYNRFYGSLEPLKNMNKLKDLRIDNTDIDSGLEYLPESVKEFHCLSEERKDAKVKAIYNLFANEQGIIETEGRKIKNFPQKLKEYKQRIENQQQSVNLPTKPIQTKPDLKHPPIGKGGYGEVYYGKWGLQDVAVKKLYLSIPNISEADLKDIQREIDILKNLRNRYIIQYYDTYSDDQEILIVMEYAENGTLTKFINENEKHDWGFNTDLIKQITKGLDYIHDKGIIHRDLKSMNILLTNGNQVKISDFGLSRSKIISSSHSTQGTTGTLRWMAPEILREKKYSEQSDIYALGMVIWEIAAKCTVPFKDVDNNLIYVCVVINGEKEAIPSDTPENIRNIIQQCWKDNPNERITLESIVEITEMQTHIQHNYPFKK